MPVHRRTGIHSASRGDPGDQDFHYETIIEPPVHSGSVDTQDLRGLSNGCQFAGGLFSRWLKPGNVSIAAQASDLIGRESFSSRRFGTLTIQDAGDNIVGIENGEAAKKGDRMFVGTDTSRLKTRQGEIHF